MLNAIKSVLADVWSVSPLSEKEESSALMKGSLLWWRAPCFDEGLTLETSANTLFMAFSISMSTLRWYIVHVYSEQSLTIFLSKTVSTLVSSTSFVDSSHYLFCFLITAQVTLVPEVFLLSKARMNGAKPNARHLREWENLWDQGKLELVFCDNYYASLWTVIAEWPFSLIQKVTWINGCDVSDVTLDMWNSGHWLWAVMNMVSQQETWNP